MSPGIRVNPKYVYLLLDMSNGDYPAKNYTWWFPSYKKALDHRNTQNAVPGKARLEGPFKYEACYQRAVKVNP